MVDHQAPLLIKRYASRRLYNTETSDYVTLDDISRFIGEGRDVQIVDLKTGDDLTRQYLLQIIAEQERNGENVLPIDVLNDLVRSYSSGNASVVPEFLRASFEILRDGQSRMMENMTAMNPMSGVAGFEALRAQQEAFISAMTGGLASSWTGIDENVASPKDGSKDETPRQEAGDDLDEIKKQLADLQGKLSKLSK